MPLDSSFIKAKPTGLYVSAAAASGSKATQPSDVTLTVGAAGAAAAATTVPMTTSADITLVKNQILEFTGGIELVVTADTAITTGGGEVSVPVDSVDGDEGDGIPAALVSGDTATWDQLYRVLGTEQSDYSVNEQSNQLRSVTYDSAESMSWDESSADSKSWQIQRSGRFKVDDYAFKQIQLAAHEDRELWLKQVSPREDGSPAQEKEGRVKVRGYSETNPASGIYDVGYTLAGQGKPTITDIAAT